MRQTQRQQVDEHSWQDRECSDAIRERQRVTDLVDACVNEYDGHRYANCEHRIAMRTVERHYRPLPVDACPYQKRYPGAANVRVWFSC
jgi:broad specificity phosphatase PhoE